MESWSAPAVPTLPRTGAGAAPLALFDSARRETAPVDVVGRAATMYVCGITPYDATHLSDAAIDVDYVQNVTDVDDPLLERAARDGEDWVVLAMRETALFREDMEALRIIPPAHYVGAVESIPAIAGHVRELLAAG